MGLPRATLAFIRDLDQNNSKEWFQANKKRYETDFKKPARAAIEEINTVLEDLSPQHVMVPGKAVNRINRDVRFSADKTPYNTKLWAKFLRTDLPKGHGAGFFFGLDLQGFGVGAGSWMFPKEKLESVRTAFAETHDEYLAIVNAPSFASYSVEGTGLKRVPKPWPADHPAGDLLKLKGIHTRCHLDLEIAFSDDFAGVVAEEFSKLKPFVDYVQAALDR